MFGFGKNKFLGIDIGTSSIKIVEIKIGNNKPILSNYAWMKLGGEFDENKGEAQDAILAKYLKRMLAEGKFRSQNTFVSMPASGGLITLIEFPEMNREDLDQAIKFEAHKYIPTSLDDITLSWDVLNKKKKDLVEKKGAAETAETVEKNTKIQVLLVAAPKKKVQKYEEVIKIAGLKLATLEIESFSLVRSLIGNDNGNFVIIDIGHRICNIILVEKGVIKVNRNIDAGGRDITKTISHGMNIDERRAEDMKMKGNNLLGKDSNIKLTTLDMIIDETKRVLSAYYKNEGEQRVDGVILSGGTAGLLGIDKYFSDILKIKTIVGNPLGRIEYEKKLDAALSKITPQFSVSIGLALKGVEESLKK
jgi:type IV pilus assembly protein PilM